MANVQFYSLKSTHPNIFISKLLVKKLKTHYSSPMMFISIKILEFSISYTEMDNQQDI